VGISIRDNSRVKSYMAEGSTLTVTARHMMVSGWMGFKNGHGTCKWPHGEIYIG
jgi:hypothetical protein